ARAARARAGRARRRRLPAHPPRSADRRRSVRGRALAARARRPGRDPADRAPPARVHRRLPPALPGPARPPVKRAAILALVAIAAPAAAAPHDRDARIAYLARALAAVRALGDPGRAAL